VVQPAESALREELRTAHANADLYRDELRESILDSHLLSLAGEDVGWIGLGASQDGDLTAEDRKRARTLSRLAYLNDPLTNRAVNIQASYVFGQGVSIGAPDKAVNEIVQQHMDEPSNQAILYSHQGMLQAEIDLQIHGDLYWAFFADATTGTVKLRRLPPGEITDIITNPEDAFEVWWYRRAWSQKGLDGKIEQRTALYPDIGKPDTAQEPGDLLGGQVQETTVFHVKVGGLGDSLYGLPETYQSIPWTKAYAQFQKDRATVARALSRFAWIAKTPGGTKAVQGVATKFSTTVGSTSGETNPSPVTGSMAVTPTGASLDPVRTSGATINPDESRRLALMAFAGFGLPETFFGDASVGSLATAQSLDRPTELKFGDRQKLWASVITRILRYVLDQQANLAEDADKHVTVSFPPLVEHDPEKRIGSIISASTLNGQPWADTLDYETYIYLILSSLGVNDIDEVMKRLVVAHDAAKAKAEADAQAAQDRAAAQAKQQADALAQQQTAQQGGGQVQQPGQQASPENLPATPAQAQPAQEAAKAVEPSEVQLPDPDDDAAWAALEAESDARLTD
jgi:hypothetical protein